MKVKNIQIKQVPKRINQKFIVSMQNDDETLTLNCNEECLDKNYLSFIRNSFDTKKDNDLNTYEIFQSIQSDF